MNLLAMDRQIRALTSAFAALRNLRIDGFDRHTTPGGISFVPKGGVAGNAYYPAKDVIIARKPIAGDYELLVREVIYRHELPKPCEGTDPNVICYYDWDGPAFDAYPPIGMRPTDFDGDEYLGETPPGIDEKFFECKRKGGVWIVERRPEGGGGGVRFGVVTPSPPSGASVLHVQPVKRQGASYVADGAADDFPIWGNAKSDDFATLAGVVGNSTTDIIPLVTVDGVEYAMQYFWFYAKTPNTSIQKGDCGL